MKTTYLILLASLTCIGTALGVDPPPDGGYPNQNTAEGEDALFNTGGADNTAIGYHALYNVQGGFANTAVGKEAMRDASGAIGNTAVGLQALASNVDGDLNTAVGDSALLLNNGGVGNTALGTSCMHENTTGGYNTGTGYFALYSCITGGGNVATGYAALNTNNGNNNTAVGTNAMVYNAFGNDNTATGYNALAQSSGRSNTAIGSRAMAQNTGGSANIAVGQRAGFNLKTGSNDIYIGSFGVDGDNGVTRIGNTNVSTNAYIAGISGVTVAAGVGVVIDSNGHLGTITSSARYKEAIKPIKDASEAILSLQPVSFRYKKELDPKAIPQFGLVAEEVEKIDPDLVARDAEGKPYTVRYEAVNAMLLNEFLKEHKKVEAQGKEIAELKSALASQAELLQKISARVDATLPAARLVENR